MRKDPNNHKLFERLNWDRNLSRKSFLKNPIRKDDRNLLLGEIWKNKLNQSHTQNQRNFDRGPHIHWNSSPKRMGNS